MPSLTKITLDQLQVGGRLEEEYPIFFETGTNKGRTIFEMEKIFKELHTTEVAEELFYQTKDSYSGDKINFYLGDTSVMLKDILRKLTGNAVFFLDAHGHGKLGKAEGSSKFVPLIEELQSIMSHFKHRAVVIIDDCRLFRRSSWSRDGVSVDKVLDVVRGRIDKKYYLPSRLSKTDRLVIHLGRDEFS